MNAHVLVGTERSRLAALLDLPSPTPEECEEGMKLVREAGASDRNCVRGRNPCPGKAQGDTGGCRGHNHIHFWSKLPREYHNKPH